MNRGRSRRLHLLFPFLLGLPTLEAGAVPVQTTDRSIPVEDMARSADVIGVATVQAKQARRDVATGLICTDFTLAFSEIWKGSPPDPLVLVKAGGTLEGKASAIVGREYKLEVGESMVLFATRSPKETYAAIGIRQGIYRMAAGPDPMLFRISDYPEAPGASSTLRLGALREQVFRVLPRPPGAAASTRAGADSGASGREPTGGPAMKSPATAAPGPTPTPELASGGSPGRFLLVLGALAGILGVTAVIIRKKL